MKLTKSIIILATIAAIFGAFRLFPAPKHGMVLTHNQIAGPAYLKKGASDLKGTIVTPDLEQEIVSGRNVLWCSTFQLAWNELYDLGGGPIKLKPASPVQDILNKRIASKADIDAASYVAKAGFIEDGAIDQIRQELSSKFHGQESPDLLNQVKMTHGFIAYGYLFKSLPFEWAFRRFSDKLKFQKTPVECFGIQQYEPEYDIREKRSGKQVSVIDVRGADDLIIELKTLQTDDRLILAKVPPRKTLQATVRMVQDRVIAAKPSAMAGPIDLYIPVLDFDVLKDFTDVRGRSIQCANVRLNGQPIDVALQSIRFRLDETGAVLKSEAMMMMSIGPPSLIFDKPFLVMLQRKDAKTPYFALWVGNTELLLPAGAGRPK